MVFRLRNEHHSSRRNELLVLIRYQVVDRQRTVHLANEHCVDAHVDACEDGNDADDVDAYQDEKAFASELVNEDVSEDAQSFDEDDFEV